MSGVVQPQLTCPHPGQVREHTSRKKHRGGYVHIVPLSTCSRAQASLRPSCRMLAYKSHQQWLKTPRKSFRMKELVQWVAKELQPYQTAELADAQDRIKELEKQLAQQRKRGATEAETGAEPIESSQPSEPSQPEATPSSKRVRLPFKSNPSQAKPSKGKGKHKPSGQEVASQEDPRTLTEKAFDPKFTPSKILSSNAPLTVQHRPLPSGLPSSA